MMARSNTAHCWWVKECPSLSLLSLSPFMFPPFIWSTMTATAFPLVKLLNLLVRVGLKKISKIIISSFLILVSQQKKRRGGLYEIFHNFFDLFSQPFPKLVVCNNLFWLPPTLCPGRREVKFIGNLFIIVRLSSPAGKGRKVLLLLSKLKQIVWFVYECLSIPFHENSKSWVKGEFIYFSSASPWKLTEYLIECSVSLREK